MKESRILAEGDRIRVLVVDDSVVVRRAVSHVLESDPRIEVVGVAASGELALQKVDQLNPDVVTLDVEMPGMNGLETLVELRRRRPGLRVVMLSTLTGPGARTSVEALSLGADDCAAKSLAGVTFEQSLSHLRDELSGKIKQFFPIPAGGLTASPNGPGAAVRPAPGQAVDAIVLGVSTGGPTALAQVLPALPADFKLPLLIVQHMPPAFTKLLAERLDSQSRIRVREAESGIPVEPGEALIAPGDFHLRLSRRGSEVYTVLDQSAPENCCRPAVDVLFRSASEVWGKYVAAFVMTGMGQDGLAGARSLWAGGSPVYAQDEPSSVVWGMPGEIVRHGLADFVLPLEAIAPAMAALSRHRS
ncbi:MAG: chemotaxis response regulator protein-glutamate methylesterase [Bryobacter sp.]|jgi:two-component system chemotaxis response regulator CheB|nr:chemotaxis response regulator protein-glutamate methylesterase [Bryobacter sp. CoA8 C33]